MCMSVCMLAGLCGQASVGTASWADDLDYYVPPARSRQFMLSRSMGLHHLLLKWNHQGHNCSWQMWLMPSMGLTPSTLRFQPSKLYISKLTKRPYLLAVGSADAEPRRGTPPLRHAVLRNAARRSKGVTSCNRHAARRCGRAGSDRTGGGHCAALARQLKIVLAPGRSADGHILHVHLHTAPRIEAWCLLTNTL